MLFFTRVKVVRLLGINPTKMKSSQLRNFCLWRTVVVYFNNNKATTTIFSFCHIRIHLRSSDQKLWDGRATSQQPFVQLLWTHCLKKRVFLLKRCLKTILWLQLFEHCKTNLNSTLLKNKTNWYLQRNNFLSKPNCCSFCL